MNEPSENFPPRSRKKTKEKKIACPDVLPPFERVVINRDCGSLEKTEKGPGSTAFRRKKKGRERRSPPLFATGLSS